MWKHIVEFIKNLYIRLSCVMCCKSNCNIELGRNSPPPEAPTENTASTAVRQTEL